MKQILNEYKDEDLFTLLNKGKDEAFEVLYERYWEKMFKVAVNRLSSADLAKEAVQDVFTSLWLKRESLLINNFSAYIFASLKYTILNYIRSQIAKEKYVDMMLKAQQVDNSTEETVSLNELEHRVARAIDTLPSRCKTIFTLSRFEDYSMNEIAEKLDITPKTVENQLGKALKLLRDNIKNYCLTLL